MLWATGGGGALIVGGFGTTPQGVVGLRVEPVPRVWIAALAAFPLVENVLRAPGGSADVRVQSFTAEFGYRFLEPVRGFTLDAGASAGLATFAADVDTGTQSSGPARTARAGMLLVRTGASAELNSWFCLRASLALGASVPHPAVVIAGSKAATLGPALGALSLMAEFGWGLGAGAP
jgi:hypothetical protein